MSLSILYFFVSSIRTLSLFLSKFPALISVSRFFSPFEWRERCVSLKIGLVRHALCRGHCLSTSVSPTLPYPCIYSPPAFPPCFAPYDRLIRPLARIQSPLRSRGEAASIATSKCLPTRMHQGTPGGLPCYLRPLPPPPVFLFSTPLLFFDQVDKGTNNWVYERTRAKKMQSDFLWRPVLFIAILLFYSVSPEDTDELENYVSLLSVKSCPYFSI